ncbi:SusC/RagA family TonB-linked outer membrane protein [Labilibaculum euxinus]|nr:TonB-dependent receptor [Labilibaculum euxinus]
MRKKLEQKSRSNLKHYQLMFLLFLSVVFCSSTIGLAQEKVEGIVLDEIGSPLPGVTVLIKSTTIGTITNSEGYFNLDAKVGDIVSISFIGYKTYDINVAKEMPKQEVHLEADFVGLEEVVAIGYGTQRKGDVTSAVASVKSEDFLSGNTQGAADLIKGKVAGLVITKASGDPNASSSINLRGMVSLEGSSDPLILVDGIPGGLNTVAPENIASIDVLKDASAAAIYGTRGAGGVIIITTKSGKRMQKPEVSYAGYYTTSEFYKEADFMDAEDIRAGKTVFKDAGYDTDWLKSIKQKAYTHNHSVSISGGTENATYSGNITYRQEEGIIKSTGNDELKLNFDVNQYFLNDIVKVNLNIVKGLHKHDIADPKDAYRQALIRNPTLPVRNEDGSYREDFSVLQYYNPDAILQEKDGENRSEYTRITGNLTVEPIKGWKTNVMVATKRSFSNDKTYTTSKFYKATTNNRIGEAYQKSYNDQTDYLEATSSYEKTVADHRISALVGYSYQESFFESFLASNYGFPTDYFGYDNLKAGTALTDGKANMESERKEDKLIGFFGRVSYSFKNRYNILASIRREGSSKFGENHEWGNFPSVSLGWTISEESFMDSFSWLDNFKLRAGYGVTGVVPKDPYLSISRYSYGDDNYFDGSDWKKGLGVVSNPNPDLKWEKSAEYNIGLDISVFDNRLSASANYYQKKTTDMLYWFNVPVPPNLYNQTLANVGEMKNTGFDISIDATPVKSKDFTWHTNVTLSHNENKLVSLSNDLYQSENYWYTNYATDPISLPTHRVDIGKSMGQFWGMKSVGLTEDGFWLIEDPETGEAVKFNDDVKADDKYRQYLGSGIPKLNVGWNNTFKYKDFDLVLQMSGQFGHKILNAQRMFYENNSISYNRLKSAADDVYGVAPLANNLTQTLVSYYLEDGDYVKMDNITLGYTFSKVKFIENLRVYVSGENLFTITDYSGLDPELATDFKAAGLDDRDKYPSIRSYTIGVNLTF